MKSSVSLVRVRFKSRIVEFAYGSDTRRGRPSLHRRFAIRHAEQRWRGSPESFGMGAAILMGDLLLSWTDGMYHASGLPAGALRRGQAVLDLMRPPIRTSGSCG